MSAVCLLCFYDMCRINEVLPMNAPLGILTTWLSTRLLHCPPPQDRPRPTCQSNSLSPSYAEEGVRVSGGDPPPLLIRLLNNQAAPDEFAFPSLTKIPRGAIKKASHIDTPIATNGFAKVGIKWDSTMSDNNLTQVLNVVASACGINESVLDDNV
ncbi:hypothetical protein PybrP1_005718 [[Pythium] brassicae (nom. inval.)]|nr:hypothetical protein PybrP1_005718 [[Pythium] brassicae (nom. inval.)]